MRILPVVVLGWILVCLPCGASASILEYTFNDSGTTTASSGSAAGEVANLYSASGATLVATDLHSAAGTGVAGDLVGSALFGTDRAINASDGIAVNMTSTAVSGLSSWTVSGWYKPTSSLVPGSAFFQTPGDNGFFSKGFAVRANDVNDLRVGIDSATTSTATNSFDPVGEWVFFAVTYDGSLTTNNVKVYEGFRDDTEAVSAGAASAAVTLKAVLSLNKGTPLSSTGYSMGARLSSTDYGTLSSPSIIQSQPALFDNFRVDAGVSDSATLDAIRAGDVAVPEPGSLALLLGGLAMALGRRRGNPGRQPIPFEKEKVKEKVSGTSSGSNRITG
jgi:hypothetical protein